MRSIKLLDCTLRDGGYVNDWEFGHNNLISIFERLSDSGVDFIEVGFLDERRPFDINRSISPDTKSLKKIWRNIKNRPESIVGMIDYGTCRIEKLEPCEESFLDGIRVIFKKHIMHEAMEFCAEVKKLGYKVFSQLVSVTSYNDEELIELAKLVNSVKPYAVSMVDTYGLLTPKKLRHIYEILDRYVDKDIVIGFHAHNNFQLAFANCLEFLDKDSSRDILVDGTLFGMGKSAGNAPIELLAMYLNDNHSKNYNISSMLECIDESINDFFLQSPWGYKLFFYLCAKNQCHPSYLSYLQNKDNLSLTKIDKVLAKIKPEPKKLLYDKNIAEDIYNQYTKNEFKIDKSLDCIKRELNGFNILLIGPGKNIQLQEEKIIEFVDNNKPKIISVNFVPSSIDVDYVFVTKTKRFQEMADSLHKKKNENIKLIATSNIEIVSWMEGITIEKTCLIKEQDDYKDNPFIMILQLLKDINIKEVACAGFDGYSGKEDNYFNPQMEYPFIKSKAEILNKSIHDILNERFKDMKLDFITYSHYTKEEDSYEATF